MAAGSGPKASPSAAPHFALRCGSKRERRALQERAEREQHLGTQRALGLSQERLRALSRRLLEVQEQERGHLARELHDDIGQALTALKIQLEPLRLPPVDACL